MAKLLFYWRKLKNTFWFVPIFTICINIGLAFLLIYIDSTADITVENIGEYAFLHSSDSVRSILTTIAGAMVGVAGTVFSITLVVLTLASNQFGSRIIKNFMYKRLNQIVIGSYISTFMYCLIVLSVTKDYGGVKFIPIVSVFGAILLSLLNIILLIFYIHHVAISIQANNVISNIADMLSDNVETLFPEELGNEFDDSKEHAVEITKKDYNYRYTINSQKKGYLQYIDLEKLIHIAQDVNGFIEIHFRPGDFLVKNITMCTLYSDKSIEDRNPEKENIDDQFIIGNSRILAQDAEFAIHQMVEIASRALSPGINDPYTAITCIDNLTNTMVYLSNVKFPSKYRYDDDDNLRIIVKATTYEGMLNASFNQIRQFSKDSPSVIIRLMDAMITLNKFAKKDSHKKAIIKHAEMILNMAEKSITEPLDIKDLNERFEKLKFKN